MNGDVFSAAISFEPALPWMWIGVLAMCGLVALWLARRSGWAAALLQLLALAWVLAVLANPVRRGELPVPAPAETQVVLLDTSASMSLGGARPRWREGLDWAAPLLEGKETRLVTFDAGCDLSGARPTSATGRASRLAQALERVAAGDTPPAHLVVVSDGVFDDPREIDRALAKLRARQVAVSTHLVGRDEVVPNLFLRRIDAPRFAPAESQVPVRIDVGAIGLPAETRATLRLLGEDRRVLAEREWSGETLEFTIPLGLRGEQITAQLATAPGEVSDADNTATFRIEPLHPKIRVFLAEGSKTRHRFADELVHAARFFPTAFQRAGDIECDLFQTRGWNERGKPVFYVTGFDEAEKSVLDFSRTMPGDRDGWWRYDVVIISDIDQEIFLPHMETVRQLVSERGGGFLMNGGNLSFDMGNYDQTTWEKLFPVDCLQFGYGHRWRKTLAHFSASARRHPILQFTESRALNDRILDVHPPLGGYHDIRRVKPGAVTLATVESSGAPLIAVQDYGRGRTMAFLSDPAGGWGNDYEGVWGPALLAEQPADTEVPGERALVEDASLAVNEFYNRFWVNTIRWLAAHSVRRQEHTLLGRAATATVRAGERLGVSAELRTGDPADALAACSVGVRAGAGGERVPLRFDRDRNEFVGEVSVPATGEAGAVALLFDALSGAQSFSDAVTVPVVRMESEFERTKPDARFMEDIARAGSGRVLHEAGEARAVVESTRRSAAETRVPFTLPLWDRAWMWAIFVALVGLKWWLWRRGQAPAPERRSRPLEAMAARALVAAALLTAARAGEAPLITKVARVCVIFGHPGDDAHRETYKTMRAQLEKAWRARFGVPAEALRISESPARDEALALVRESAAAARPDAAVWFLFIGHGNKTRTGAAFNLPGPDLTEKDLREALDTAAARGPLVLLCTQAASGGWVRALAGPQRFIFAATRTYEQDNETELPVALAAALESEHTDANRDGVVTLMEIFEACRVSVAAIYASRGNLPTETPSLDADGDGRASTRPAPGDAAAAARIGLTTQPHTP